MRLFTKGLYMFRNLQMRMCSKGLAQLFGAAFHGEGERRMAVALLIGIFQTTLINKNYEKTCTIQQKVLPLHTSKGDNRKKSLGEGSWFETPDDDKGEMAEWSIAAVLKTVEGHTSGGSNPSLSAIKPDFQAFIVFTHEITHDF